MVALDSGIVSVNTQGRPKGPPLHVSHRRFGSLQRWVPSAGLSAGVPDGLGDLGEAGVVLVCAPEAVGDVTHRQPGVQVGPADGRAGGGVAIWHNREELEATSMRDFYARAGDDWHHTVLDSADVLHSSEHKVHVLIQFTRCAADSSAIATYRSLWIMTDANGRWGAQARSSFAP